MEMIDEFLRKFSGFFKTEILYATFRRIRGRSFGYDLFELLEEVVQQCSPAGASAPMDAAASTAGEWAPRGRTDISEDSEAAAKLLVIQEAAVSATEALERYWDSRKGHGRRYAGRVMPCIDHGGR